MNFIKKIPPKVAAYVLIITMLIALAYHALIMSGHIDFRYVWGGRLQSSKEMVRFEITSMLLNVFILAVVMSRVGFIKPIMKMQLIRFFLMVFFVLFILNTIGNLLAIQNLETYIFTPLTLISAICCLRLAIKD